MPYLSPESLRDPGGPSPPLGAKCVFYVLNVTALNALSDCVRNRNHQREKHADPEEQREDRRHVLHERAVTIPRPSM